MYSPKIKEELIYELYRLKLKTGRAMTKHVNQAVKEYIEKIKKQEESNDGRENLYR